jgi:hypothetical protein
MGDETIITDEMARGLVQEGILEKCLEGKNLTDAQKDSMYRQGIIEWAIDQKKAIMLARKKMKEGGGQMLVDSAPEKPLGA